jgi:hypothetical protein
MRSVAGQKGQEFFVRALLHPPFLKLSLNFRECEMKPNFAPMLTFSCPLGLDESSQSYFWMLSARIHVPGIE